ncbi:hypothetical protein HYU92_00970 [Candidatus Curtissbacteria bacterium]|nr:hypothetical protein [Candidatus Curtissbacteria bacterium]
MQIIIIIFLFLIILLLLYLLIIFLLFAFDAFLELPYVATRRDKISTIIKLASIKKGDTVIDLGSGDGRLLFAAAKKGAHAIGYELNPLLVMFTRFKAGLLGYSSSERQRVEKSLIISSRQARTIKKGTITIKRQDLWEADLSSANVIFVYGRAKTMPRFEKFVYQNAKRGARIIVNTDKTIPFPTKNPTKAENGFYLYKV